MIIDYKTIEADGKKYAQIPLDMFEEMQERLIDQSDIEAVMEAKNSSEPTIPGEVIKRVVLEDANPITAIREYRGLNKAELGKAAGVSGQHISMMEAGKRKGTIDIYAAIADALDVPLDFLVER